MLGMFNPNRPDPEAVRRIKLLITERFSLDENTTISVAELRCHEPDCPPVETIITVRRANGCLQDWRVTKPLSDVELADIEILCNQT